MDTICFVPIGLIRSPFPQTAEPHRPLYRDTGPVRAQRDEVIVMVKAAAGVEALNRNDIEGIVLYGRQPNKPNCAPVRSKQ